MVCCLRHLIIIIVIACVNEPRFVIIVIQLTLRPDRYRTARPSVSPLQVPTLYILFTTHAYLSPFIVFLFYLIPFFFLHFISQT